MIRSVTFIAFAAFIGLTGCASNRTPRNYLPVTTQLSFPELNVETTVSIGSDMLGQGTRMETNGVTLSEENNINNFILSAGFYPQVGEDENYTYHSYQIGTGLDGMGGLSLGGGLLFGPVIYPQSIRFSRNEQQTCIVTGNIGGTPCDSEHSFQRTTRPTISDRNFQQTLIYSDRVGDRIRIGYRESSGNMARPAFSNEAEYDLSTSNEIAYRGARIRILSASNTSITYVVLSNFNSSN